MITIIPALCLARYLSRYCFFFRPNHVHEAWESFFALSMAKQATLLKMKKIHKMTRNTEKWQLWQGLSFNVYNNYKSYRISPQFVLSLVIKKRNVHEKYKYICRTFNLGSINPMSWWGKPGSTICSTYDISG